MKIFFILWFAAWTMSDKVWNSFQTKISQKEQKQICVMLRHKYKHIQI